MTIRHTCNATLLSRDGVIVPIELDKREIVRRFTKEMGPDGIPLPEGDGTLGTYKNNADYKFCEDAPVVDTPPVWGREVIDQTYTQNVAITPFDVGADGLVSGNNVTYTSSTIPPGLTLSSAGVLTGTPTVVDVTAVTVRATNSGGFEDSAPFNITVNA